MGVGERREAIQDADTRSCGFRRKETKTCEYSNNELTHRSRRALFKLSE